MNNNNPIIASLLASLFTSPVIADEARCKDNQFCTPLAQQGKLLMNSQVQTRTLGSIISNTPPSAEYRRPDEVVVIGSEARQETVVYDEKHVSESSAKNEQSKAVNYESGENFLSDAEREQLL